MRKSVKLAAVVGGVLATAMSIVPLTTYAASTVSTGTTGNPANPNVSVSVPKTLTIDAASNGSLEADYNTVKTGTFTIKVTSNFGYTISLKADSHADLRNGSDINNVIAAGTPTAGQNFWAIMKKGGTDMNDNNTNGAYQTISNTQNLAYYKATSGTDASGVTTTFTFGVSISKVLPAATYSTTVVATATANS